ncbi:MAG: HTH-type transcriptional repressor CzrA [Alphaproteobacteria bacterium ADurb.BinA280]|nr:MAG: HTH-type transcriptional repressor CzrA [Alphaproteobacteria bacterium ADurb.BinA280]
MDTRQHKNYLYEQVARIGKALCSSKRLELLELLTQGEKPVETLAQQAAIDLRLCSAHLRALREARLVQTQRAGKHVFYRLASDEVALLWVTLRDSAERHLLELQLAMQQLGSHSTSLTREDRMSLMHRAQRGEITVIDVRPATEYSCAHLPFARSLPLSELRLRIDELPRDQTVVAYCRGPFCVMSDQAVELLREHGFMAEKLSDGINEWRAAGLALEVPSPAPTRPNHARTSSRRMS